MNEREWMNVTGLVNIILPINAIYLPFKSDVVQFAVSPAYSEKLKPVQSNQILMELNISAKLLLLVHYVLKY